MPVPMPAALTRWRSRAQRLVTLYGWRGADAEDLVAWMVLEFLEQPSRRLGAYYCYQHAMDHVWPRHGPRGARVRDTWVPWRDRPSEGMVWPEPLVQAALVAAIHDLPQGERSLRMALLVHGYGWMRSQIAHQEGCDPSRVTQLLQRFAAHVRPHLTAWRDTG